jgi:hypothetical protein
MCPGNGVLSIQTQHSPGAECSTIYDLLHDKSVTLCKIIAAQRGAGKNNDWPE